MQLGFLNWGGAAAGWSDPSTPTARQRRGAVDQFSTMLLQPRMGFYKLIKVLAAPLEDRQLYKKSLFWEPGIKST